MSNYSHLHDSVSDAFRPQPVPTHTHRSPQGPISDDESVVSTDDDSSSYFSSSYHHHPIPPLPPLGLERRLHHKFLASMDHIAVLYEQDAFDPITLLALFTSGSGLQQDWKTDLEGIFVSSTSTHGCTCDEEALLLEEADSSRCRFCQRRGSNDDVTNRVFLLRSIGHLHVVLVYWEEIVDPSSLREVPRMSSSSTDPTTPTTTSQHRRRGSLNSPKVPSVYEIEGPAATSTLIVSGERVSDVVRSSSAASPPTSTTVPPASSSQARQPRTPTRGATSTTTIASTPTIFRIAPDQPYSYSLTTRPRRFESTKMSVAVLRRMLALFALVLPFRIPFLGLRLQRNFFLSSVPDVKKVRRLVGPMVAQIPVLVRQHQATLFGGIESVLEEGVDSAYRTRNNIVERIGEAVVSLEVVDVVEESPVGQLHGGVRPVKKRRTTTKTKEVGECVCHVIVAVDGINVIGIWSRKSLRWVLKPSDIRVMLLYSSAAVREFVQRQRMRFEEEQRKKKTRRRKKKKRRRKRKGRRRRRGRRSKEEEAEHEARRWMMRWDDDEGDGSMYAYDPVFLHTGYTRRRQVRLYTRVYAASPDGSRLKRRSVHPGPFEHNFTLMLVAFDDPREEFLPSLKKTYARIRHSMEVFCSFLCVKASQKLSMRAFMEFPGLLHFVYVDRMRSSVVAPDIPRTSGMDGLWLKRQVWRMNDLVEKYREMHYVRALIATKTVLFSWNSYVITCRNTGSSEKKYGLREPSFEYEDDEFGHVELYALYLPFVSVDAITSCNRKLLAQLARIEVDWNQ